MSIITTSVPITVFKTQAQAQLEALNYIKKRASGEITSLKTSWNSFNNAHIDGIESRRIITVAGMSSSGKSAIVNQLSNELHILNPRDDFAILNFNFEMMSSDIELRKVISQLGINNRELLSADGIMLSNEQMSRVENFLSPGRANPNIYYCEYPKTVKAYTTIVKKYAEVLRKKLLIITDHSALFKKGLSETNTQEVLYSLGDGSIELKKEVDCTQIHVSQLNRDIEKEDRRKLKSGVNYPIKGDIFGSDALFMCSDTVLVNHRPKMCNLPVNSYGPHGWPCGDNDIYWHWLKLRQADVGISHMLADFSRFVIKDKTAQQTLHT